MNVELVKEFYLEAAHRVPQSQGPGARLHGHSLKVEVVVQGEVDPEPGWLVDYGEIKLRFQPFYERLDHHYINEVHGMTDPSLAGIGAWIKERLAPGLPGLVDVRVSIVGDNRYDPGYVRADPDLNMPTRLRFSFEAAQSLPQLPREHPCHRLHGHSYRVEVGAEDFQALEPLLRELYDELDHRCLNDIDGLETATCEHICKWMWDRLSRRIGDLTVIVVQETSTSRCIYRGA